MANALKGVQQFRVDDRPACAICPTRHMCEAFRDDVVFQILGCPLWSQETRERIKARNSTPKELN